MHVGGADYLWSSHCLFYMLGTCELTNYVPIFHKTRNQLSVNKITCVLHQSSAMATSLLLQALLCATILLGNNEGGHAASTMRTMNTRQYLWYKHIKVLTNHLQLNCQGRASLSLALKQAQPFGEQLDKNGHKIYQHLLDLLQKCDIEGSTKTLNGINRAGILPAYFSNRQKSAITSNEDLPTECTSLWTLNLTEFYRVNTSNTAGDLGVLDAARTWFRFTGAAGSQVSNNCSQCATFTKTGFWTDINLSIEIAETKQILFYQSCNKSLSNTFHGTVTRCSEDKYGLVYRFDDQMRKDGIICGMN